MNAWTKETARRFRSAKVVVLTSEAGTCGGLCARSESGTLLAIGPRGEFEAIARKAGVSLIDRAA